MAVTYRAVYLGASEVVYSYDAAKAWVSQQAGRRLRWRESTDEKAWYGFKTAAEAEAADMNCPSGFFARILVSTHPDF